MDFLMSNRGRFLPLLALVVVVAIGCGKGNSTMPSEVTGKVTFKDKVVGAGTVTFFTQAGVYGPTPIGVDGTYTLKAIPDGEAEVTVETESGNKNANKPTYGPKDGKGGMSPPPAGVVPPASGEYVKIPGKYAAKATSGLKVTLVSGKQTYDIPLKD